MERVVNRSDLHSEGSEPPSSPEANHFRSIQDFEYVKTTDQNLPALQQDEDKDEEEGFDFQLFAPTASKDAGPIVTKIRLKSPDLENVEPGLVNPHRDRRYYFTGEPTAVAKRNFEAAALSGADVFTLSRAPWPGMQYAWKVAHVPATKRQLLKLAASDAVYKKLVDESGSSKHKRPGKKARLAVRKKLAAKKAKQQESQKAAELKEAAEREKRTQRNREKKVKKKNREKAKKAQDEAGNANNDDGAGNYDDTAMDTND